MSDTISGLLLLILVVAQVWILKDLWPQDERTDLLHLPFAPARILWSVSLLTAALISFGAALRTPADHSPQTEAPGP